MGKESPYKPSILAGQAALVTGGGSGIGFEITRQLGLHGAKVVIMGRRESVLKSAKEALEAEGIQVRTVQGDVRKSEDCSKAVDTIVSEFGHLDILVNAAAGNFLTPAEALSPNGFKTVMEIDAVGTFTMSHAAFPLLKRGSSGHGAATGPVSLIINISATLHYGATWYQAHSSAAKAAVDSLTRSLALEWGHDYGIRVVGIAPGPIANTTGLFKLDPTRAGGLTFDVADIVPLGRVGESWDIAMAVLFLASNAASWISGETLVVDGAAWLFKPQYIDRETIQKLSRANEAQTRGKEILQFRAKAGDGAVRSKL